MQRADDIKLIENETWKRSRTNMTFKHGFKTHKKYLFIYYLFKLYKYYVWSAIINSWRSWETIVK